MVRRTKSAALATRESILDAAAGCYCTHGVSGTTMALIAARAGCSRGAIYWHFHEPVDILQAILERGRPQLRERLEAAAEAGPPVLAALRSCLRQYLCGLETDEHVRCALEIVLHRCDFAGEAATRLLEPWHKEQSLIRLALCRGFERAQRFGELREGLQSGSCAALLHFALLGALKFDLMQSARPTPNCGAATAVDMVFDLTHAASNGDSTSAGATAIDGRLFHSQ